MCGIVGYIGSEECLPILINGLKKLEYRGYDSSGIALASSNDIEIIKSKGNLKNLENELNSKKYDSNMGIGHTRWATHGIPSVLNAHPHVCCENNIALVHNGIIENYQELKKELKSKGHKFCSETDTEVLVHLVEENIKETTSFREAVEKSLSKVKGSYAITVMNKNEPETLIAARKDSPLVIGSAKDGNFVASDIPAILEKTRNISILDDNEIAILKANSVDFYSNGKKVNKKPIEVTWDLEAAEKGGYEDFMLKEIYEQPKAVKETLRAYLNGKKIDLSFLGLKKVDLKEIDRIFVLACGTSYHAAWVGKLIIEQWANLPVEIDISSEFRYRFPVLSENTLILAVTQSGETADTLAGVKEALNRGQKTLAITNVLGSTITREANGVLLTQAGPEIGVAATKTFTTQISVLYLLALELAKVRGTLSDAEIQKKIEDILTLPAKIEEALSTAEAIEKLAGEYYKKPDFLFLGRGFGLPVALEGALKLKEISYIHAEGCAAGEMKHGPIALIDENCPIVAVANKSKTYAKVVSNIEEVKARGADVIAVISENEKLLKNYLKKYITVPLIDEALSPITTIIPLQLFAYYMAKAKGLNVDQPRNLAKSVTVE
ncbi:MAG: glutamine--fructose-6-phosphate transaminase (isomerizing) [Actinobacteria bacterium]|nr:MAG: glutamine--fructose-6-phosphate transaminase (isomerizing) [Actinomycetota bacterium]